MHCVGKKGQINRRMHFSENTRLTPGVSSWGTRWRSSRGSCSDRPAIGAKANLSSPRGNQVNDESTEVALLLAPMGRDAIVLQQLLQDANISCSRCESIGELTARLSDKTTFVIITEEVLISAHLQVIAGWIGAQPSWSDLPILILTKTGDGTERNPVASRLVSIFGNVSFLERPCHPTTLSALVDDAGPVVESAASCRRCDEGHRLTSRLFPDKAGGLEMSGAATAMPVARNRETSEKLHCAR